MTTKQKPSKPKRAAKPAPKPAAKAAKAAMIKKPAPDAATKKAAVKKPAAKRRRRLDPDYVPHAGESYMSAKQRAYFENALIRMRADLMLGVEKTVSHMQEGPKSIPDENDRASKESEFAIELRERDRDRSLLRKIERALNAIHSGDYGKCEECSCPIGVARLIARPVATLCIECKRLQEQREKMHLA
jgi:DnaK suppressor protein